MSVKLGPWLWEQNTVGEQSAERNIWIQGRSNRWLESTVWRLCALQLTMSRRLSPAVWMRCEAHVTIVPEKVEMCTKVGRKLEGRVYLFTYLWLIYDVVSGSDNIASNDEHKMYLKWYGRKMSDLIWLTITYSICLDWLRISTTTLNKNSWYSDRDLNPGPAKY
jgi:hypothetical protein